MVEQPNIINAGSSILWSNGLLGDVHDAASWTSWPIL